MTALPETPAVPENPAAAAQALRMKALERGRVVVDYVNRGVAIPEIAARVGVTEDGARAILRDMLAWSAPDSPETFAAIQTSRLNEALLVAFSAMSEGNLAAVDRVVRIVRALDRHAAALFARPLARPPALDRDAAPSALADGRNRNPIVAEVVENMDSRSLDPTPVAKAGAVADEPTPVPIHPRESADPEPPGRNWSERPGLAHRLLDPRFRGDDSRDGSGLAPDPLGLAASRWRGTAASAGALAAAGA